MRGGTAGHMEVVLLAALALPTLAFAQGAAPAILSGTVLTPIINVDQPPASPAVRVRYHTQNGLGTINLQFASDVTGRLVNVGFTAPPGSPMPADGVLVIRSPMGPGGNNLDNNTTLDLYAANGTWTLVQGAISDQAGQTTEYEKSQFPAIFATPSFQVANQNGQDIKPPAVVSGTILTPTVSLSAPVPAFQTSLNVTDNKSGVASVKLALYPPGAAYPYAYTSDSPTTIKSGSMFATALLSATDPVGTWGIQSVNICDFAGNCAFFYGTDAVTKIFGTDTFTVTK